MSPAPLRMIINTISAARKAMPPPRIKGNTAMRRSRTAKAATEMRISLKPGVHGIHYVLHILLYVIVPYCFIRPARIPDFETGRFPVHCSGKGFMPVFRIVITMTGDTRDAGDLGA